jgi:hypothetical protein
MRQNTAMVGLTLAALLIGTAGAEAGDNSSGEPTGGALYGPMPGQVFGTGQGYTARGAFGFAGRRADGYRPDGYGAYGYAGGRATYGYAGPRARALADPTEGDNSAGHLRYHWEEY